MRDRFDTGTGDIFSVSDRALPGGPAAASDPQHIARKPRVRIQGTCVLLVEHPALPPIGFAELKRLGSLAEALRQRLRHHKDMAAWLRFTYQNSAELPVPTSAEGMRHVILCYRYSEALADLEGR